MRRRCGITRSSRGRSASSSRCWFCSCASCRRSPSSRRARWFRRPGSRREGCGGGREGRGRYYGLMAEFDNPTAIVAAARRAYAEGYRRMDAYTPFPVEGLDEALHFRHTQVPLIVLLGGLTGCLGGYFLQYWIMAI